MLCENLLRFLNSNVTGGSIDKRLNYLQGILFLGLLKIQIISKMKITKGKIYLACFLMAIWKSRHQHLDIDIGSGIGINIGIRILCSFYSV